MLRAVWDSGGACWYAIEGTHRLHAARALGLLPALLPVTWDAAAEQLNADSHDCWTGDELRRFLIGHAIECLRLQFPA